MICSCLCHNDTIKSICCSCVCDIDNFPKKIQSPKLEEFMK